MYRLLKGRELMQPVIQFKRKCALDWAYSMAIQVRLREQRYHSNISIEKTYNSKFRCVQSNEAVNIL